MDSNQSTLKRTRPVNLWGCMLEAAGPSGAALRSTKASIPFRGLAIAPSTSLDPDDVILEGQRDITSDRAAFSLRVGILPQSRGRGPSERPIPVSFQRSLCRWPELLALVWARRLRVGVILSGF